MKIRKGTKYNIPGTKMKMVTTYTFNLSELEGIIDLFEIDYLRLSMLYFYVVEKSDTDWMDGLTVSVAFRKNFLAKAKNNILYD
jgi:hypothetical protein